MFAVRAASLPRVGGRRPTDRFLEALGEHAWGCWLAITQSVEGGRKGHFNPNLPDDHQDVRGKMY